MITDYWITDEEMRGFLQAMANMDKKKTQAERDADVDKQMKQDARKIFLALTCVTKDAMINFVPTVGMKYKDIPFKAGSYEIEGRRKSKPGVIRALVYVQEESLATQGGTFTITEWNKRHMAGTFDLKARTEDGENKEITIKGSFDLACKAGKGCEK